MADLKKEAVASADGRGRRKVVLKSDWDNNKPFTV